MRRRLSTLIAVAALGVAPLLIAPSTKSDVALAADGTIILDDASYRVAPGLFMRKWTQNAGGLTNQGYALIGSLDEPSLGLGYLGSGRLRTRLPLSTLVVGNGAVAGVNASFFDISDTGAPIGTAVSAGQILYATTTSYPAFVIDANRVGDIRAIEMREITNTGWPTLDSKIESYNQPEMPGNTIGMYDSKWYSTVGRRVMSNGTTTFQEVWVTNGVVTRNTSGLTDGAVIPPGTQVLLGHGAGATILKAIPVGTPLNLQVALYGNLNLQFAVSSHKRLMTAGVTDPRVTSSGLAPRTAVGWDNAQRRVILAVINGRSEDSDGVTENGLTNAMRLLGADDALLLDGGGSSEMIARYAGRMYIWNSPSDGGERAVSNGLGFTTNAADPTF